MLFYNVDIVGLYHVPGPTAPDQTVERNNFHCSVLNVPDKTEIKKYN